MENLKKNANDYLVNCACIRKYSEHTIKAYRTDLAGFFRFLATLPCELLTGNLLPRLTREHLRAYLQSLQIAKPRTIRRKIACLRSFFGYLHDEKLVAVNITEGWKCGVKIGLSLPRTISRAVVREILEHGIGEGD